MPRRLIRLIDRLFDLFMVLVLALIFVGFIHKNHDQWLWLAWTIFLFTATWVIANAYSLVTRYRRKLRIA